MSPAIGDEKFGWRRPGDIPAPAVADVERMLAVWLAGRRVREIELLSGGLMNRNCRVRLSDGAQVVLRLYDRDEDSAAKEVAILELLHGDLPVPVVLHAEPAPTNDDPPWAILEFVDATSLARLKRSGDSMAIGEAAYDAGRLLARLQSHRFPEPGYLTGTLTVHTIGLPSPLTTSRLVEMSSRADAFRRRIDRDLLDDLVRTAFEWDENPRALSMPVTLTHGDFGASNLLVGHSGGIWRVAAILDWEFAFAGSLTCDVGHFLRYENPQRPRFEPSFSRGLRDAGAALEGDWFQAARMADLPALCELLTHPSIPDDIVAEVIGLVTATMAFVKAT